MNAFAVLSRPAAAALLICSVWGLSAPAQAFVSDNEARAAILELRQEVQRLNEALARSQSGVETGDRARLQLLEQIEQLRAEVAQLRGQVEVLGQEVQQARTSQTDLFRNLDERLQRFEPSPISIDGQEVLVDPAQRTAFEQAQQLFQESDFAAAKDAFGRFVLSHPESPLTPQATFFLGSSQYALRDWRATVTSMTEMASKFPQSARTPDALLIAAAAQFELNDRRAARLTLERIIAAYPSSTAATTARERLALLTP